MENIFHLAPEFEGDANLFRQETARFRSGDLSAPEFRSFRVPMGVYEQREADTYMLRVRFPAGGVLPHQMRALARVSRAYGNGLPHVTTRQDIQIHRVLIDDIPAAFEELYAAGLSTRGGGGNTVRNITACHDAGVCPDEVFDPSPFAIALSEFMLPDPLSYQLPRKYKIAFSGCSRDCPGASVHDLGFFARLQGDTPGFAVYVGGGLGATSRVSEFFEEFVPADEVHLVAEAVKRVFDKHGNRKNRKKARLRFLVQKLGVDGFRDLYRAELEAIRSAGLPPLEIRALPGRPHRDPAPASEPGAGYARWERENVSAQRQDGYRVVRIPLMLGDIACDVLESLAEIVERYGEGMLRTTQWQNLVLRWVHDSELAEVHAKLDEHGLALADPPAFRNMVACTGASTCKLGIGLSRGLAKATRRTLEESGADLSPLGPLNIHISGCPNSCGRHPVADIGLHGAARRVRGRLVPHYVLQVGGRVAEGEARLARGRQAIPARNVPPLLVDLLEAYRKSPRCPDFGGFLEDEGESVIEELAARYGDVPDFEVDKNYYFDWDGDEIFSLAGRGPGECGAGVFDLIEVDLQSAGDALQEERLYDATVLAARSLLVTRGQQADSETGALSLFTEHFLSEGLVDESFSTLLEAAHGASLSADPASAFTAETSRVSLFVAAIRDLYDGMDPSLRFSPVATATAPVTETVLPEIAREADFRGVVCPLNYVKTKMLLDQMQSGSVLSVLLDEEGTKNVPESVEGDGHAVLSIEQEGDQWKVLIRKA